LLGVHHRDYAARGAAAALDFHRQGDDREALGRLEARIRDILEGRDAVAK
jgi:hypothetical protein